MDGYNKAIDSVSHEPYKLIQAVLILLLLSSVVVVHNRRISAEQKPWIFNRVAYEPRRGKTEKQQNKGLPRCALSSSIFGERDDVTLLQHRAL